MEVAVAPPPPLDTNFGSTCSTPYLSASSSPQRLNNFFFSAPTSPTHQFTHNPSLKDANFSSSSIPFTWEETPGTPKNRNYKNTLDGDDEDDFEFNFSGNLLERDSLSAEDLFFQGKIKPLKPPPARLQLSESETEQGLNGNFITASSSPRSPRKGNIFYETFSSPKKSNYDDPFEIALENSKKLFQENNNLEGNNSKRGRGKTGNSGARMKSKKASRSLSPFRVSDVLLGDDDLGKRVQKNCETTSFWAGFSFYKAYRKWRIKDLLFRSASEGRCTDKIDPGLSKYVEIRKQQRNDDVKYSSFRSSESFSGSMGSSRRGRGKVPVSAHELHYTVNRAVSEEMKRKTFLPYKQGLLGCLGFNPSVHDISRGGGSLPRV